MYQPGGHPFGYTVDIIYLENFYVYYLRGQDLLQLC